MAFQVAVLQLFIANLILIVIFFCLFSKKVDSREYVYAEMIHFYYFLRDRILARSAQSCRIAEIDAFGQIAAATGR